MKPELNITESAVPVGAGDLSALRVEVVWCDEAGEPVKSRSLPVLRLLSRRGRKAAGQAA